MRSRKKKRDRVSRNEESRERERDENFSKTGKTQRASDGMEGESGKTHRERIRKGGVFLLFILYFVRFGKQNEKRIKLKRVRRRPDREEGKLIGR